MKLINQVVISTLFALSVSVLPFNAQAADSMKPGQWEVTVKTGMKNMPAIPPAQLAEMKKMGIKMPGGSEPVQVQTCVTPEQASLDNLPKQQQNKNCKMQNFKHTGNTASGEMVCTGDMQANGKFEMTMESDTAYHATSTLKGVSKDGGPIDQSTDITGKWIKAKCDPNVASQNNKR